MSGELLTPAEATPQVQSFDSSLLKRIGRHRFFQPAVRALGVLSIAAAPAIVFVTQDSEAASRSGQGRNCSTLTLKGNPDISVKEIDVETEIDFFSDQSAAKQEFLTNPMFVNNLNKIQEAMKAKAAEQMGQTITFKPYTKRDTNKNFQPQYTDSGGTELLLYDLYTSSPPQITGPGQKRVPKLYIYGNNFGVAVNTFPGVYTYSFRDKAYTIISMDYLRDGRLNEAEWIHFHEVEMHGGVKQNIHEDEKSSADGSFMNVSINSKSVLMRQAPTYTFSTDATVTDFNVNGFCTVDGNINPTTTPTTPTSIAVRTLAPGESRNFVPTSLRAGGF